MSILPILVSRVRAASCCALVLMGVLGAASAASGQATEGVISGTITDGQGAVLPGASVTIRNVETGVVRSTVTGSDGQYRVPALPPGRYDVAVELQGFTTTQVTGLVL